MLCCAQGASLSRAPAIAMVLLALSAHEYALNALIVVALALTL